MSFILDSSERGMRMLFSDWEIEVLKYLWLIGNTGANSNDVWTSINQLLDGSISRASVINFLSTLADNGVLIYTEETGKGGVHRIYQSMFMETEFKVFIAKHFLTKLIHEFPKETRKAISLMMLVGS